MQEIGIGIDLGGTRIKAVALDAQGHLLQENYQPTNDGDDIVWKNAVLEAIKAIKKNIPASQYLIGLSAPGLPNAGNTEISFMPGRLQGLEGFNWGHFLQSPTYVINDAVAALMAEARFGAAKNIKNVAMLTLGTGVGGAILIDGRPYQGNFNKAGHIGHMVVDHEGDADVTGMPGSLEECIGNCTIEKRSDGKFSSTHALLDAYRSGDTFARTIWLRSVKQLAIGLASIINILSPETIVLGGGITQAGKDLFEPLEQFLNQYEWRPGGQKTNIVQAQSGDMAGAIGAASFAMEKSNYNKI